MMRGVVVVCGKTDFLIFFINNYREYLYNSSK